MNNLFVDSDVFLDYMLDRKPFSESSSIFLLHSFKVGLKVNTTPLVISNIYYLLRKQSTHQKVITALQTLTEKVNIIKVNESSVSRALESGWLDFEDALQYFSVIQYKSIEAIITRNKKDYQGTEISIMTPLEYIRAYSLT